MPLGFPRRFGKYFLLKPLAQGGMGALYLAMSGERGMEKLCALKTVLPHLADKEYVGRFRDEAKVVVKLQHGNLVTVFDAGQVGGELYLAMEFIEGRDLRAVWNRCARKGIAFPVEVAVHIVKELCRGLAYAHSFQDLELVHRDVSPPNVLLAYSGEVKLTDFGLATSTLKIEKTVPGVVYGKVSYMSPEQARGESLDPRTDLYTAGILLWELLTGRQLFPQGERSPGELLLEVKDPKIAPPSSRASRVTPALDRISLRALEIDRTRRYQSGEEMRTALAAFLAQEAPTTDAARVAAFLKELFGEDIEKERRDREALVQEARERLHTGPATKPVAASGNGASGRLAPAGAAEADALPPPPAPSASTPSALDSAATADPLGAGSAAGAGSSVGSAPPAAFQIDVSQIQLQGRLIDGRYKVLSLVGEGGMGRVYEAEHVEIGRRVAMKVLHPVYSRTPEVVERFRREARAASRIGHPNIVEVTDSGTTPEGSVYFVMEYLEGVELAKVIAEGGALAIERALHVASQICKAVAAAHARGIIHRDLKPENIFLITREGVADFVKVLDFGIAKSAAELLESRERKLTHPGMAMGTPEYMAPEQAAGRPYDHRIDVYSTGAILYEMLTGVPPFDGESFMEILNKKATEEPLPPRKLRTELSEDIERIVLYTLQNDPKERPPSMEALDFEIGKAIASHSAARRSRPGVPMAGSGPELAGMSGELGRIARRRKRMVTLGLGGALGITIIIAGVAASRREQPTVGRSAVAEPRPRAVTQPAPAAPGPPAPPVASSTPWVAPGAGAIPLPPPGGAARRPGKDSAAVARRQLAEARRQLAAGHYVEAKQGFSRLTEGRERASALAGLGEIAFQQSSYAEAARLASQALKAGGGAQARVLLGNAYFRQQRFADAIREYNAVLAEQPNHPEARRGLEAAERRQSGR
ncbi:MAG TPA: protein kinase [Polyangia bacterium]|nr:protein kinase [Polyangia bacterium]